MWREIYHVRARAGKFGCIVKSFGARALPYTNTSSTWRAKRAQGMSGEKERVTRLETRAREAENALQQLRAYIELLRKKASTEK